MPIDTNCVCVETVNNVEYALKGKKGLYTCLLDEVCINVQSGPQLKTLQDEVLNHRTSNTGDMARLDINARNFWSSGQDAFFDIRISHVNVASYRDLDTTIYSRQEQEKNNPYYQCVMKIEQGTFTPRLLSVPMEEWKWSVINVWQIYQKVKEEVCERTKTRNVVRSEQSLVLNFSGPHFCV